MLRKLLSGLMLNVVLVASLTALAPQAGAQTLPQRPAIGANLHLLWSDWTDGQRTAAIDLLGDAGAQWVRIDVAWSSLQPDGPDTYRSWVADWVERYATQAHARGMKVLVTFWNTPGWANGNKGRAVAPDDPQDLARAAAWISNRLRDSVDAWEVWNEANLASFFSGSAADYVELLKAAYPAFKEGDPSAPVVSAGTSYADAAWIEKMYAAGARGSFDILGVHPYMAPADLPPETENGEMWTISAVDVIRKVMNRNGDSDREIWFTEFGWSSHTNEFKSCKEVYGSNRDVDPDDGVGCGSNATMGVTEEQQGAYLVRAFDYVTQKNVTAGWNVSNMIWYNTRNKASGKVHEDNFGLLNRDLSTKPVYDAFKSYATAGVDTTTPLPVSSEPSNEPPASKLRNGGFEEGTTPWRSPKGIFELASIARSGAYSGKVRGGRIRTLVSEMISIERPGRVTASGFVRLPRPWLSVRMQIIEKGALGRRVLSSVPVKANGTGWVQVPETSVDVLGHTKLAIRFKMKSERHRRFWVDDVSLHVESAS